MKSQPAPFKPTFESVWALTQELHLAQKETDRIVKETSEAANKTLLAIDKLKETVGGLTNNIGQFAEDYFVNSFQKGEYNFFGEKFDEIKPNRKGVVTDDEYDILLINGKSVCIIETKFKAHIKHIPKVLNKAKTFRLNFPQYQNYNVYLGIASLSFYEELEEECKNKGIAIIKQLGDNVVIIDEGLKTY